MARELDSIPAIITARGGSKGLPRKNVLPLGGKPLIAWTIEAALAVPDVSTVIVSTDDAEIADTARAAGATVPFMRPAELSQDDSPHIPVVLHAIDHLATQHPWVLLLQPTSPFRTGEDIAAAIALARSRPCDAVVSVCEAASHPWLVQREAEDGFLAPFTPRPDGYLRRQSFPAAYALNGAMYLIRTDVLRATGTFTPPRTLPYVMPAERSLDIDTAWDLRLAQAVLDARRR